MTLARAHLGRSGRITVVPLPDALCAARSCWARERTTARYGSRRDCENLPRFSTVWAAARTTGRRSAGEVRQGRLLGRFFATSRKRVKEVAEQLGLKARAQPGRLRDNLSQRKSRDAWPTLARSVVMSFSRLTMIWMTPSCRCNCPVATTA